MGSNMFFYIKYFYNKCRYPIVIMKSHIHQSPESHEISFERVFNRADMKMTRLMSELCILYRRPYAVTCGKQGLTEAIILSKVPVDWFWPGFS